MGCYFGFTVTVVAAPHLSMCSRGQAVFLQRFYGRHPVGRARLSHCTALTNYVPASNVLSCCNIMCVSVQLQWASK